MNKNDEYKKEFLNETCLNIAVPLVKAAMSWMSIEEAGDKEKARELPFEALGKSMLYMTNVDKEKPGFAKLYIVSTGNNTVRRLYVKKDVLYPGERYHNVTKT